MLQHDGVINRIDWMWTQYGFNSQDVVLQKTAYTFDVSVWELLMPVCWGCKMIICPKELAGSPEDILSLIRRYHVTCLHFVPSMLNAFMFSLFARPDIDMLQDTRSLRRVITSGEALSLDTVKKWYQKLSVPIFNLYGPTEASIDVTYYDTSETDTVIPIGKPIWNTQVYVLSREAQLNPIGVPGELYLGGVGLSRGYINNEKLSREKFVENPFEAGKRLYKTGDIGRWNRDGNIEFLGRADDQVKVRGYRIEIKEIENALASFLEIESIAVIPWNNGSEDELVAYFVSRQPVSIGELRTHAALRLPSYMLPNHYIQLDTLPVTLNGKLDRRKLPVPGSTKSLAGSTYAAPQTPMEKEVAEVWQAVLNKDTIGANEDFFELGGDSFKAIRMVSRFQNGISILDLYNNPTVAQLAKHIAARNSARMLERLTPPSHTHTRSVIIVPYAAGESIVYRNFADALHACDPTLAVYCLRFDRSNALDDVAATYEETITAMTDDIASQVDTPVFIHSECIGSSIALVLAERLERKGVHVAGLFVAGAFPPLKYNSAKTDPKNNERVVKFFADIGASVPQDAEARMLFTRNMNYDAELSRVAGNSLVEARKRGDRRTSKIRMACIVGGEDPLTKNYQKKYRGWKNYFDDVALFVIHDVGHYISRDRSQELAHLVNTMIRDISDTSTPKSTTTTNGYWKQFRQLMQRKLFLKE